MKSIFVLMISIITIIIAVTGKAVDLQTDKNLIRVASEIESCPYLDNAEYKVTVKGSVSTLIGGCAYIYYNNTDIKSQSFSLWFGNIYNEAEHCSDNGFEYFRFYCLSKSPTPAEDIRRGRMYIKLYDDIVKKGEKQDRRCAMYDKTEGEDYVTTLRIAVSSNDSCNGLSDILNLPQKIRLQKKGSMLLTFSRTRPDAPLTPAVTATTESLQSISSRYEKRGYILENFGNRLTPFWRTKLTEIQGNAKRELQMNDADGRHGAVTDIASYDDFQSDTKDKDVNTSAIKEPNSLSQPLEANHTQIRRRRSESNVTSTTSKTDVTSTTSKTDVTSTTSKTDVTMLASENPLDRGNYVQKNDTGYMNPFNIMEEIMVLFLDLIDKVIFLLTEIHKMLV